MTSTEMEKRLIETNDAHRKLCEEEARLFGEIQRLQAIDPTNQKLERLRAMLASIPASKNWRIRERDELRALKAAPDDSRRVT